jgi:hypothetical protein
MPTTKKAGAYEDHPTGTDANGGVDPHPCGEVAVYEFDSLVDGGLRDADGILVCGDAYYIQHIGRDVKAAVDRLTQDFFDGQFAPDEGPVQSMLCRYIKIGERGMSDDRLFEILDATFEGEWVDGLMDALGDAFDAHEHACGTTRPGVQAPSVRSSRQALSRAIGEFQRELSRRGGAGLRLVVHESGAKLVDGLAIVASHEVQWHAGPRFTGDVVAALAALTDAPLEEVRARALRASSVRRMSRALAAVADHDLFDLTDGDLDAISDPLGDWPDRAAPEATTLGGAASDALAERRRQLVESRQSAARARFAD